MQIPVEPVDVRLPAIEHLGVQALAHLEDDLLVGLCLIEAGHGNHGAARRPPRTGGVAFGAHSDGQQDVGQRDGSRRQIRIGIHDERDALHGSHDTRSVLRRAAQRVGRLDPHHLNPVREVRLDCLQQAVGRRMGDEVAAFDLQCEVVVQLLGAPLGRRQMLAGSIAGVDLERVVHQDVAAGHIDIAAQSHKLAAGKRQSHSGTLLVERKAPLNGTGLRVRIEARGSADQLRIEVADGTRPLGRGLLDGLPQLVEAGAPHGYVLSVVQALADDDVEPCARQRSIGAGTQLQPVFSAHAPPRQTGIDGDDLRSQLSTDDQPMADVSVGVRGQRLVAPDHDHLRRNPLGVVVTVGMRLGRVHDREIAERGDGAADARHVARKARETERRDVRRLQAGLAEERHLPVDVAARAMHADDRVAAIGFPNGLDALFDDVVGLVPADALPLVLAALAGALHGVLQAVRVVDGLIERQALDAQFAVRARIKRVALNALDLAILHIQKDAAGRMASRRRIVIRTRNGIAVLFPLPLALVVGLTVDAVQKFLIKTHNTPSF